MQVGRLVLLVMTCLAACSWGCAPAANGVMRPTLPWTRQVPASSPPNNPWGSPTNGLSSVSPPALPSSTAANSRWSFLGDLMKRADQQELLAQRQRQEIERLSQAQKERYDQERAYVMQQREKERNALAKQYEEKQRLLAQREEKYRGQFEQARGLASDLDVNNRDLHAQLAKSQQERELLQDEIDLLKQRLDESTRQLSQTRNVSRETGRRLQALQASSAKTRGNASIRANSSVGRPITAVMVPGMDIRQDGDLVRIAIPADKLFMTGTASLHQGSQEYMEQVASILQRYYPQQIAGIEAHTDHASTSLGGTQWRNDHQLTAAQSMAVFEQLTARNLNSHQLFVLGHGGNHPLVSDGTPEGQSINRRIEIVIYPETYGRQ